MHPIRIVKAILFKSVMTFHKNCIRNWNELHVGRYFRQILCKSLTKTWNPVYTKAGFLILNKNSLGHISTETLFFCLPTCLNIHLKTSKFTVLRKFIRINEELLRNHNKTPTTSSYSTLKCTFIIQTLISCKYTSNDTSSTYQQYIQHAYHINRKI